MQDKPEDNIDIQKMNRILRHRLRNLSAGVKMTVDRIADVTARTHPQLRTRCQIINSELDNLETFTDRMDLLFDTLPEGHQLTLHEIISMVGEDFSKAFPFCTIDFEGDEIPVRFPNGSLLLTALKEVITNAGEGAASDGFVKITWNADKHFSLFIINPGEIHAEIPIAPPQAFNTVKGRHDGIGLAIISRICKSLGIELLINNCEGNVAVQLKIPPKEWQNE